MSQAYKGNTRKAQENTEHKTLHAKGRACEGVVKKAQRDATLSLLAVNPTAAYHAVGQVSGTRVCFMLDTGAAVSLIRKDVWDRLEHSPRELQPWTGHKLVGVEGSPIKVHGLATVDVRLAGNTVQGEFVIADSLRASAILGLDFLEKNQCVIDTARRTMNVQGVVIPLESPPQGLEITSSDVAVQETLRIPAFSERETMARVFQPLTDGNWLLGSAMRDDLPVLVAGAVVTPVLGEGMVCVPVRLANPTPVEITIHQGTRVARVERLDEAQISAVLDPTMSETVSLQGPEVTPEKQTVPWEAVECTAANVGMSEREELYGLLYTTQTSLPAVVASLGVQEC